MSLYNQLKAEAAIRRESGIVAQPSSKPETSGAPVFLEVAYCEKDQAKALGAKWDKIERKWFIPPGTALKTFDRWL